MTGTRIWKRPAGVAIVLLAGLATACTPGHRAASPASSAGQSAAASTPPDSVPAPAATGTPQAANPATDPQVDADTQAITAALDQIDRELSAIDQATNTGENDVPST